MRPMIAMMIAAAPTAIPAMAPEPREVFGRSEVSEALVGTAVVTDRMAVWLTVPVAVSEGMEDQAEVVAGIELTGRPAGQSALPL